MTTVLVIGSGAREHALAWRLAKDGAAVHIAPGNAGTAEVGTNHALDIGSNEACLALCQSIAADLVVIGPEGPLVAGLVDVLRNAGLTAFGPTAAAARLEGSKIFSKEIMSAQGVPTAAFRVFEDPQLAKDWIRAEDRPLVVKADGLAAGKGVVVAKDADEACEAIHRIMVERAFGSAGDRVLVEDLLVGAEVSYHVLCAGTAYVPLASAQDHKRLLAGDEGPNTGGMGAYSPVPWVTSKVVAQIHQEIVEPTLRGMVENGTPFTGVLFIGLMVHEGYAKVLEYNVRFGDPECEVLMMRWAGPLLPTLMAASIGELASVKPTWDVPAAMTVILASEGYPQATQVGRPIDHVPSPTSSCHVFHGGTRRDENGELHTSGGRVMAVSATGDDFAEVTARVYEAAHQIKFEGKQFRPDIGWQTRPV